MKVSTAGWLALAFAVGCQHAGSGVGVLRAPLADAQGSMQARGNVAFTWRSDSDPSVGTIEATLPDERRFRGSYAQPRATQWRHDYDLYWGAWTTPWGLARPWYVGPRTDFTTHYSGKALAHLEAPDGTRMRCEFTLFEADRGLAGGGQGDCQLSTNEEVFDAVLRSDES